MTPVPSVEHHEVIVIGAGISGICAAVGLREAGVDDVLVLEKAETYGGTWRANTYPGCACDVPSGLYSFSFAPKADWSRLYGTQPEILAYVDEVARSRGLDEVTRFGVEVLEAAWEDDRWRIRTDRGNLTADHLVAAAGPWNEPRIPDLPGLADHAGAVFHSARWDHDVDLVGKRVAVIGSGASAVQFVPEILPRVAELHLFQRTAHWVLPKVDVAVPATVARMLGRLPGALGVLRRVEHTAMELVGAAFHRPRPLMHVLQAVGRAHLRVAVRDRALREKLTPRYLLGCKRILFSNHYLQALTDQRVSVHATGVERVEGDSVVGSDGTRAEVDVVILGTGFHILDMPLARRVRGREGRTLAEHWAGSPEAYLGTAVAGFPNAYLVLGPSLGSGHTSAFTIAEAQVRLVVEAITTARRERAVVEVRSSSQAAYVESVQAALVGTAYTASQCHSYYLDQNGRNSFSWPWSTDELVRRVGRFEVDDFERTPVTQPATQPTTQPTTQPVDP